MNKIVSLFDNILKLAAATYLFLTIAAFIDLKIYYGKFGVAINEYISVSEAFFLALDQILLIIVVLLIQLGVWLYVFGYLFDYNINESVADGKPRQKEYHDETIHRSFKSKTLRILWLTIIVGTILFAVLSIAFPNITLFSSVREFFLLNYWVAMCLYMMWLQTTRALWQTWKSKQTEAKIVLTLVVFISVLILSIWVKNSLLFKRVYKKGNNKQTAIILNDNSTIMATDTIRFIGQTEKFFFYWNKSTTQVSIYPISDVKRITLK